MNTVLQRMIESIETVLLTIINLPLRLLLGIGIIVLLMFRREIPERLWEGFSGPVKARIIPLR